MKSKITSYLFTFLFLLLTSSLLSITSILLEKIIKDEKTLQIIISIFSLIIFLIASVIFGVKIKSKGLINGVILALIYLIMVLIFKKTETTFLSTTLIGAKMLTLIIGTMMGVNLNN